jgi:hypothetical protein
MPSLPRTRECASATPRAAIRLTTGFGSAPRALPLAGSGGGLSARWFGPTAGSHEGLRSYLPPGRIYFGSREAHRLTYTSCQESHDRLFRKIAAELGTSGAAVRRALTGPGGLFA